MEAAVKNEDRRPGIVFRDREHEHFFFWMLRESDCYDVYHQALAYCLGLSEDVRKHILEIYDFSSRCVEPGCLKQGWITSGSERIIRLGFNLFCNGTPSVDEVKGDKAKLEECSLYNVEHLFCCGYAYYFWQAIRLRYPEYCEG